jgi:two-component system NtrC family sensor kinase
MGSLRVILENELPQWEPKLAEKNITFHCDLADDLSPVLIDFDQIGRSVSNLIANGIDAIATNGVLQLSLHQDKNYQVIIVSDSGSGISQEIQQKIFEPFFTTKSRGTGLGLAIVKQIIEYHQGTISVWSEDGAGTKFTIKLPVRTEV